MSPAQLSSAFFDNVPTDVLSEYKKSILEVISNHLNKEEYESLVKPTAQFMYERYKNRNSRYSYIIFDQSHYGWMDSDFDNWILINFY